MRIVAGVASGRPIASPNWQGLRPTTDKVRGAIFNSLASSCPAGLGHVVDIFAGTGANGIEALSRGASSVTFIEQHRKAVALIRDNIASCFHDADDVGETRIIQANAMIAVSKLPKCDVAILDPPYAFDDWAQLLEKLNATVIVCESNREIPLHQKWQTMRCKSYGDTVITIGRLSAVS